MLNRFKSYGLIAIIYLCAVADALGQSNCPTCPKGMTAPSTITSPLQGFHGYTSESLHFDGTTPTCYTPTANTLNGHLNGINNRLCNFKSRIDSLWRKDTLFLRRIDSLINAIDDINDEFESTYNTSVISSDSSVNVDADIVGSVQQFDLSVDIDSVKSKIIHNLNISCLGATRNFDSILNTLIRIACYQSDPANDSCKIWRLYSTNSISSTAGTTQVSVTPYSIGAVPSDMCLTKIEYIYTLKDAGGASMANGLINGSTALGSPVVFTIPYGYVHGARTIQITSRFWKEKCTSHKYCGTLDSTLTSNVPVFSLTPINVNDDTYTTTGTSTVSKDVCSNDVLPYAFYSSLLIRGATKGSASLVGCSLTYTPITTGIDTLRYKITDIYGQSDTAYIYITNNVSVGLDVSFSGSTTNICIVQCGSTPKKYLQTVSLVGSGTNFGSIYRIRKLTITSDTNTLIRNFSPNITQSTFNSTLTGVSGAMYTSINSIGGQAVVEFSFYDNLGTLRVGSVTYTFSQLTCDNSATCNGEYDSSEVISFY